MSSPIRIETPNFYHSKSFKQSGKFDDTNPANLSLFSFGADFFEKKTDKKNKKNVCSKEFSKSNTKSNQIESCEGFSQNYDSQDRKCLRNDKKRSTGPVLPQSFCPKIQFHQGDDGATLIL